MVNAFEYLRGKYLNIISHIFENYLIKYIVSNTLKGGELTSCYHSESLDIVILSI